eukprot:6059534-Pyramimonas_sp.AAC.1
MEATALTRRRCHVGMGGLGGQVLRTLFAQWMDRRGGAERGPWKGNGGIGDGERSPGVGNEEDEVRRKYTRSGHQSQKGREYTHSGHQSQKGRANMCHTAHAPL